MKICIKIALALLPAVLTPLTARAQAPLLPSPFASGPAQGAPLVDPSGSRAPTTYARRYQVAVTLVMKGEIPVGQDDLKALTVAALQRSGVQHGRVAFVSMHPDQSWETVNRVTYSPHYNPSVANTPVDGRNLAPTDRLEVTLVVERHVTNQADRLRWLDSRARLSILTETVAVQMSGTVTSLDTNALAAAVGPVTVRKTGLLHQSIEGQEVRLEPFLQTLWFTLRLPVERRALELSRLQTPTPLGETYAAVQQAADRVVAQLETSAAVPVPAGGSNVLTPSDAGRLVFAGLDRSRTVLYLAGDLGRLRSGDRVLLPLRSVDGRARDRGQEETATGQVVTVGRTRATVRLIDPVSGRPQPLSEGEAIDVARAIEVL